MLLNPTSKKDSIQSIVVAVTQVIVIICDPTVPIFLPKNPEDIEPNRGNIIMAMYIIYIL